MVDMVLPVERSDVRAAKCTSALVAEQAEASEVVGLAQGVLAAAILVFCREELRCDYRTAVTTLEAVQVKGTIQSSHKLAG